MSTPQIIMIVMFAMSIAINLVKHGERKDEKYNVITAIFSVVLEYSILKWGGFF